MSRSLLALLALAPLATAQTTWYVDVGGTPPGTGTASDPYTSLQYAIAQPATVDGDLLSVAPGTYHEAIDFLGKTLRIQSEATAQETILDAGYKDTVVRAESGEGQGTALVGFKLRRGQTPDPSRFGCAVRVVGAALTLDRCYLIRNGSQSPLAPVAGVYAENATLFVDKTIIEGNGVGGQFGAGAIHAVGSQVTVMFSRILENRGGLGGALYLNGGSLLLEACELSKNTTNNEAGAGLYVQDGAANVIGTRFLDNFNDFDSYPGGAIHVAGGSLFAHECDFERNVASRGGAIDVSGGKAEVQNSRFFENVAVTNGVSYGSGGAVSATAPITLTRCLFVENKAQGGISGGGEGGALYGGGIVADRCTLYGNFAVLSGSAAHDATLLNSIAWGNPGVDLSGAASATYSDIEGGFAGQGNLALDPQFLDPEFPDFHLRQTSPCIDAGDPTSPADPDGTVADMGAFPFDGAYVPLPRRYCVAKTNSAGCAAKIGWTGTPTLSGSDDFRIDALGALGGQFGVLVWGYQAAQLPLFDGTQCVGGPLRLAGLGKSGGNAGGVDCTGSFTLDFTQAYMNAQGVLPYETLFAQWWYRDPGFAQPNSASLTGGLSFIVVP